jgi:hypothetical protein
MTTATQERPKTKEPWEMTRAERQAEVARLKAENQAVLATPLLSEGSISPWQVGAMGKQQRARWEKNAMLRMDVESRIKTLESDERIARAKARAEAVEADTTARTTWMHTKDDWVAARLADKPPSLSHLTDKQFAKFEAKRHAKDVKWAVSASKPVPAEVLKDYPELAPAIPKAAPGAPEGGLQVDMMGKTTLVQPKGKGKAVTAGMDDYQKLQAMKEQAKPKGKEAAILPHPSGDGYAISVGTNRWVSGGAGPMGGGSIGRWPTSDAAEREAARLGYGVIATTVETKGKPEPASDIEVGDFIGLKGEIGKGIRAPRGFVEGEGTIGKNIPAWKVRQGDDSITLIPKADATAIGKPPPPPKGLPKLEKPEPAKPTPKPTAPAKPKTKAKLPTLPPVPEGTISHEDMQILLAGMELKAEAIEERVYRGKAELEAIKEEQDPRLAKLTAIIPRTKERATELTHITKGQYRKVWGREPKPQILTKDGKSVRWEYALDEIAQELHLEDKAQREGVNPDEYVKRLIEGALDTKHMIAAMQSEIDSDERTLKAIDRLKAGMKTREAAVTRGPVTRTIAKVEPKARDKATRTAKQMAKDEALKLVEKIQSQRTPAALAMDNSILSQKVVPLHQAHVWAKAPNRYDIKGVDTPGRGRIVTGVGYADKGTKRMARKPRKGWKRVKFT